MQTLEITVGLPASGKTTYARERLKKETNLVRVNRDALREMEGDLTFSGQKLWAFNHESAVTAVAEGAVIAALDRGFNVIVDDTNLKQARIDQWQRVAHASVKAVELVVNDSFLQVDVETCIQRDLMRPHSVGKDVIESMYYAYWADQPKPANEGMWEAVICDLDGTLCLLPPGLSYPKAFNRDYRNDVPNPAVASLLEGLSFLESSWHGGPELLFLSGRDETSRPQTEEWLDQHMPPYSALIMRPAGDKRPDYIVKKELYMAHVQGKYKVQFVLDDRPSIVRMWRAELGLPVFQVGPNVEF